jgi:hypothetical protein
MSHSRRGWQEQAGKARARGRRGGCRDLAGGRCRPRCCRGVAGWHGERGERGAGGARDPLAKPSGVLAPAHVSLKAARQTGPDKRPGVARLGADGTRGGAARMPAGRGGVERERGARVARVGAVGGGTPERGPTLRSTTITRSAWHGTCQR